MRYADIKALPIMPDEAKTSIIDLIAVAVGNDKSEINMDDILGMMHKQGWDLTRSMVMDILKDNDMVKRTTKDKIILNVDTAEEPDQISDKEEEKSLSHVSKMAKKALKKGLG